MKKLTLVKLVLALYIALDWLGGASFGFLPFSPAAAAQTILTNTTLSAAVPGSQASSVVLSGSAGVISVASATGISAPTPNTSNTYGAATSESQTYLFVDRELMEVRGVSGTSITVIRGVGPTAATSHASGAVVFVVPSQFVGGSNTRALTAPAGSCTRSNELYLPRIEFASGIITDCIGGQYINGDAMQTTRSVFGSTSVFGLRLPDPGGTALTSLETAGTAAGANTEEYCTELDLPFSMLVTGLAPLNGTTVGTDKHLVILRDASGNALANSATAGATTAGASTYQHIDFTAKYYAVGPARYFGCVQASGTTDTLRHLITAVNNNVIAGKLTGQTFGTVSAAPTMPTTFTTALGPYYQLY